jgi:hypothetical protein
MSERPRRHARSAPPHRLSPSRWPDISIFNMIRASAGGDISSTSWQFCNFTSRFVTVKSVKSRTDGSRSGGPGAELAVDAGIHSIEHGAQLSEDIIAKVRARGTRLVATNSILFHPTGIGQGDAKEPTITAMVTQARASAHDSLRLVRAAGLNVAVGTDSMHGLIGFEMGVACAARMVPAGCSLGLPWRSAGHQCRWPLRCQGG